LTYRIDSQSKLPRLMTWNDEMGDKDETQIDYPEIGPADIYDLGVPRTVTIVDRIPSDEVRRVVSERSSGRRQFDDYIAYVLEERILPENTFPRVQAYRVSRKGRKWRIDRLRPLKEDWIPPRDANVRWWRDQQKSFVAVPKIVSNGPAYWDYYIGDNWKPGDAVAAAGGEIVGPNGLEGPGNDPDLPFWCQDLMPEQAGHPTAGIGDPDDDRVFSIEAKPLDGPRATIMLYGRNPLVPNAGPDHFRVWLDPAAGYLSKRVEVRVVDDKDHSKVAYIDTHIIEAFEKSPKGRWYPTKVRQLATGGDYEFVRTFYVDFEAVAPDESFEPLR